MRLGLLSTARINDEILDGASLLDGIAVEAVASRDAERADAYARKRGIPRAHATYEALLDDDEIDAVYVPLPNGMHHEWTMRALHSGKHVLCEKPYSRRPAEVEEAFDLAGRSDLVLMEAFMYRHHPQTATVAELVAGGAIGQLRTIRVTSGFQLDRPEDVRLAADLDGGALMDVGCYCISGSRLLAGEPERVYGEQVTGETGSTSPSTESFASPTMSSRSSTVRSCRRTASGSRRSATRARSSSHPVPARSRPRRHAPPRGRVSWHRDSRGPHVRARARELRLGDRG